MDNIIIGVESSPSIRRSNSYRVALRKSGVPKEYIEQLDQQLILSEVTALKNGNINETGITPTITTTAAIATTTTTTVTTSTNNNIDTAGKTFKRNFRGSNRMRKDAQMSTTPNTATTTATSITIPDIIIDTNNKPEVVNVVQNRFENQLQTDDNEKQMQLLNQSLLQAEPKPIDADNDENFDCRHLLCLICCNYCCRGRNRLKRNGETLLTKIPVNENFEVY